MGTSWVYCYNKELWEQAGCIVTIKSYGKGVAYVAAASEESDTVSALEEQAVTEQNVTIIHGGKVSCRMVQ
jgi:hypothetical protein